MRVLRSDAPYGGRATPSSVTIPAISAAGVTSNTGFHTAAPSAAMRCPPSDVTSTPGRSSTGISSPLATPRSTVDSGAAT